MFREDRIYCSRYCQEKESIRGLTLQILAIDKPEIMKIRAQDLLEKAEEFLDYWQYQQGSRDCALCQRISRIRKKVALFTIGVCELEIGSEGKKESEAEK